jgi:hypothetical protein
VLESAQRGTIFGGMALIDNELLSGDARCQKRRAPRSG